MELQNVEEITIEPVSPVGHYFNSSVLSISILCVLEIEVPIDDSPTFPLLKDVFLPINPGFSSIMVTGNNGVKRWKRVEVQLKDHVNVPTFQAGMSSQFYDECLHDYLSKLSEKPLPQSRPLWEIHIIKYPTSNAAGTLIFKIHHALGDGFSLMGALLSCLQRADDPSHPLTFPSVQVRSDDNGGNIFKTVPKFFSSLFNSASDFCHSFLKSSVSEDDQTPIRSGSGGLSTGKISISTMTFPLHQIKQIKNYRGVTVNDVLTGIIFLGTRLYILEVSKESGNLHSTAVVLLNTRMFRSYSSVEEMVKPDAEAPWGNHFAFLHVSIPKLTDAELQNPLEFIKKAQEIINSKRKSFGVYLTASLLDFVKRFRGPESLLLTILSCMGNIRVAIGAENGFIDSRKLKSCIENAFDMIRNATSRTPSI